MVFMKGAKSWNFSWDDIPHIPRQADVGVEYALLKLSQSSVLALSSSECHFTFRCAQILRYTFDQRAGSTISRVREELWAGLHYGICMWSSGSDYPRIGRCQLSRRFPTVRSAINSVLSRTNPKGNPKATSMHSPSLSATHVSELLHLT
jgi:hypothetical protein